MQNPPIDPQLLKSAIFGMKRRAMNRDNQSFQQQFQNHTMKQLADMQGQGMTREQAMKELQGQQQSRIDQDEQSGAAFEQDMRNMHAQRNNPLYSMSPQGRKAALGRSVDQQLLQEKVDAQNQQIQNRQQERAVAQQMRTPDGPDKPKGAAAYNPAFAKTVDRNMGISNEQIGNQPQYSQQQVASNRGGQQQPNQNMAGYDQAKANLLKMNPNLGVPGHADNTNFINSLKASYGDNYREHLQQNPQLLTQHYGSMQPQNTNQSVASQPASPVPAAPAAPAGSIPSTPIPNSPFTMSGNPSANLTGSTVSPGSGKVNPVASKPTSPVQPVAAANTAAPVAPAAPAAPVTPQVGNAGPVAPPNAGPSDAYLAKVMGSYNPRSKLDQAKASRIREMYSAGNTSPKNIYTDNTYSGINSKSPTTVTNSAQPATNTPPAPAQPVTATNAGRMPYTNAQIAEDQGALNDIQAKEDAAATSTNRIADKPPIMSAPNSPMGTPKTARDSSADLLDPESQDTFRKAASMFGLSDYAVEESLHEITKEKTASSEEGRFMNYLREELFKTAKDMGDHCPYSPKELSLISSSAENFQKAAMLEAQSFWIGLSEDLLKRGRDESFLKGILKAAQDYNDLLNVSLGPDKGMLGTLGDGGAKLWEAAKTHGGEAMEGLRQGATSLGETAKELGQATGTAATNAGQALRQATGTAATNAGQALSSTAESVRQAASAAAPKVKDATTEALGRLEEQANPYMKQFKQTAGEAVAKGKNIFNDLTSSLTSEDDRHQIIPGVGNQYLGAAGGALLSALMGGQMGLTGPASWLVPLLGGAAGYHYLPKLMNMWKDQPGTGSKKVSDSASAFNKNNPIIPLAKNMSPSQNLGTLNQKPL